MPHMQETKITTMRVRKHSLLMDEKQQNQEKVEWANVPIRPKGESMLKNMAVAAALVLCAVTLRTGVVPLPTEAGDVIMTAATDNSLLDEKLGKLSFVSSLFPEAVLVFGQSNQKELSMPVSGGMVIHAWSEDEPFMSWRTESREVLSSSKGEVIGIYHGNGDERLVQVMADDGVACLYGNLSSADVALGDQVIPGQVLGMMKPGEDLVFEVRVNGISRDPSGYMAR